MVGHKFIEALKEKDPSNKFNVVTFCEENRAAYNRMRLTEVRSLHPKLIFFFLDLPRLSQPGSWVLRSDQRGGRSTERMNEPFLRP